MKRWYALSAIGRDRPGIVADLAELIFDCDCNLEDSSMTILGSEFAVLLLLSGEGSETEQRLSSACKRVEWEKRLSVFFRPLEGAPGAQRPSARTQAFELVAVGVDKAGIVARVARCLAGHGINITQMNSSSRPEPESGTPIYSMRIQMEIPEEAEEAALRRELEHAAGDLNVDISLSRLG